LPPSPPDRAGPGEPGQDSFNAFFAALPVATFVVDPESLAILDANELAARQLGYAREEFVGLPLDRVNAELTRAELLARHRRIATGPDPMRFETTHRMKSGEIRSVLVAAKPIVIGGRRRSLVVAIDLAAQRAAEARLAEAEAHRRQLQEAEAMLAAVLDALPVSVAIAAPDGRLVRYNSANGELWGEMPPADSIEDYAQWVGRRPDTGARLAPEEWPMARALTAGEVVRGEPIDIERFGTGERRRVLINAAPVRDFAGRTVAGVVVEVDVTEHERVARQSREAAERIELALDAGAIVGTWDWPLPGDRFTADERFARSFGLDPAGCRVGLPVADLHETIHPEDRARVAAAVRAAIAQGGAYSCEYRVRQPDGTYRWLEADGRVYLGPDGRPCRFPGVLVDVDRRKADEARLVHSERRFRRMVEAASDILWTNDPDGRMTVPQPGWAAFTGQSAAEYADYGWTAQLHPDDVEPTLAAWQHSVATGEKFAVEHRVRRHDGVWRTFAVRALPVYDDDGRVLEWVGVHTDVTEIREAQRTIERQNEELRENDRRKDEFLATLAHELRNPLAPVRNALQILNQSADATVAAAARAMMGRQVAQMVRLVDDLLDISRITTGKLTLTRDRLELRRVLEQAIETARPAIDERRHRLLVLQPERELRVVGDAVRLAQIVTNLLNNAAKYSDLGGTITVRVAADGPAVRIAIEDTGIGLAPDALDHVFDLFSQVDAGAPRAQGGLGIGLALARRLARMHGGELEAASPGPGRGATFTLTLPLAAPLVPSRAADDPADAPDAHGCRIVVADDNRDAADSLAIMLKLDGHDVSTCYDGKAAIGMIHALQPDVAIVDLGMPGCDGLEVARAVRHDAEGQSPVLIALTGWGQDEDKRRTREAGFDHHFTKPVELDVLQRVIGPCG
jgi:PAS domain S-box-containing protein